MTVGQSSCPVGQAEGQFAAPGVEQHREPPPPPTHTDPDALRFTWLPSPCMTTTMDLGVDEGDVDVLLNQVGESEQELPEDLAGLLRRLLETHGRAHRAGRAVLARL